MANLPVLDLSKYLLTVENEGELFEYVLRIAKHEVARDGAVDVGDAEMLDISRWLHRQIRLIENAEKPLSFKRLKSILSRFESTFAHPHKGNRIDIYRHGRWTQVHYRGDGSEVQRNTIRKIRQDLKPER